MLKADVPGKTLAYFLRVIIAEPRINQMTAVDYSIYQYECTRNCFGITSSFTDCTREQRSSSVSHHGSCTLVTSNHNGQFG